MAVDDKTLDQLFREARTFNAWLDKPVGDDTLRKLYDLAKWVRRARTPVRHDLCSFEQNRLGAGRERPAEVFPHNPGMATLFEQNPQLVEVTARRNSSLQGAYLIMAARAIGLDCGPLSGFDNAKLDEIFFDAGRECEGCDQEFFPEGHVKSNFLCNLGYGDMSKLTPRLPRLKFEEACSLL